MQNFTPLMSLAGGIIIGCAALVLLVSIQRIAGISGIIGGLFPVIRQDLTWRLFFVAGLLLGGFVLATVYPNSLAINLTYSTPALVVAGLLVGFGSRLGNGCTSGHGICGLGRLSPRSMIAVVTFMATGIISAVMVGQIFGGAI